MAFNPRTTESGIVGNDYWTKYSYNHGAQNFIWMPNCTTYAYGRSVEISRGNINGSTIMNGYFRSAKYWYTDAVWDKSPNASDVQVGDILCWGDLSNKYDYGHVAVVESITDSYVYVSQSHFVGGYNGNPDYQSEDYPGTRSVRYFEYGYFDKTLTNFTRVYAYNQNGDLGSNWTSFSITPFNGCIHNPYADGDTPPIPDPDPEEPTEAPTIDVIPESYSVSMSKNEDYVDFAFTIQINNVPSGETVSGGNTYPGLSRIYNSGWSYSGTTAYKTQTLRYYRESNKAYTITKYMYFDLTFSTGSISETIPMYINVERKGAVLFMDGMGIDIHIV